MANPTAPEFSYAEEKLLKKGIDKDKYDEEEETPFLFLFRKGNFDKAFVRSPILLSLGSV
jgi:hypothetical protein